jgi:hypothetical protein
MRPAFDAIARGTALAPSAATQFLEADMTLLRTVLAAAALLSTAVTAQIEFKSWPLNQAPAELRPATSRADLVIVEMHGTVLRELSDALARRGPTGGFGFCHLDATAIIQRMNAIGGTVAGRTSDRLRNPANAPRAWAAPLVAAHAGQRAASVEGFAVDLGDRVGVLRPMVEQAMCGNCHGTQKQLAPGVDMVRRQRYPADRAVGFRDGDIRGWYWVEMPKQP